MEGAVGVADLLAMAGPGDNQGLLIQSLGYGYLIDGIFMEISLGIFGDLSRDFWIWIRFNWDFLCGLNGIFHQQYDIWVCLKMGYTPQINRDCSREK